MKQQKYFDRARQVMPAAGFGNYDPDVIIREGHGSRVWDEDNNEYIDYLIGSGPMILGHGHPEVIEAISEQLGKGTTFFAQNVHGIELAEEICRVIPCAEQIRYVSTGTEADMYAMRLARAFTKRDKIIKFEGGYHGMSSEAQMSLAPKHLVDFPIAVADSSGIPESVRGEMLIAPYNDIDFVRTLLLEHGSQTAAIIVEPFQRIIPPAPGFLQALRAECTKYGVILIFDEIVTGFRFTYGGAQSLYGVTPDLCTLGKLIGGGLALAAIAGKADIMAHFDKEKVGSDQFVMQIGTLSGNPLATVAGLKTLEILRRPGQYEKLHGIGESLMYGIRHRLETAGHEVQIIGHPTMFDVVFTDNPVNNYRDWLHGTRGKAVEFDAQLKKRQILKALGKFYISLALTDDDISKTLHTVTDAANNIR